MSKGKGKKNKRNIEKILLATAILQLVQSLIDLIEKLLE